MDSIPTPRTGPEACRCPLCGEDNRCETARTGRFDVDCWCRDQSFPAELLNRPETANRDRCICRRCARAAGNDERPD